MKKKDVDEPRLVERSREQLVTQSQSANVAPLLTNDIAAISNETTSSEAQIRELAFSLYEERGRRDGHDIEDWLEAEAIICSQPRQAA